MFEKSRAENNQASDLAGRMSPDFLHEIGKLLTALKAVLASNNCVPTPERRKAARAKEAMQVVGLKPSSFYARQNCKDRAWDPSFPRSFKLGSSPRSATVWYVDELEAWLEARAATRKH